MGIKTIRALTEDEQAVLVFNRRMRGANSVALNTGQKVAVCALKLAPAVQQSDYPALKAAVDAIAGIQEIELLVDFQAPNIVPSGREIRLNIDTQVRLEKQPDS
jgi:hypothetical protein